MSNMRQLSADSHEESSLPQWPSLSSDVGPDLDVGHTNAGLEHGPERTRASRKVLGLTALRVN